MEEAGYDITVKDWNYKECELEEIVKELINFDVIMLSCHSRNWYASKWIIEKLRVRNPEQILVIGGIQATLFGQKIIEEFPVNYVIKGEGEKSLIPLLKLIEKKGRPQDVPGLIYKENGEIRVNPVSQLLTPEEMSHLPVPLYEKLESGIYSWLPIESSRGCVHNCIFCAVPYQRNWRPLSAETFVNRIESYIPYLDKVLAGKFLFIDDSFIINVNRAKEIAGLLRKRKLEIEASWNANVPELFQEKTLLELDPYTNTILVGAESFNEESLKKIGKNFKPEDIRKSAEIAMKIGILEKLIFSFIIGFPWQNKETIIEEIDKIYDFVSATGACTLIHWLTLNPGSQIWNEFYKKNNVPLRDYGRLIGKWKEEVLPVSPQEQEEINFYIKYLQSTIPKGIYKFQQNPSTYDKVA